ncbi:MAG: orotate phosphoribosyltransferase [Firmicutes bacterium]|nr:orotate phosphoribosyltransferase [Bacillota bacterium]
MATSEATVLLQETQALRSGHFRLTSGRHSDHYVQCAQLFQYPQKTARLASVLAKNVDATAIDVVVGPAIGGIIWAYEFARQLQARAIYAERENGHMRLRRDFTIRPGEVALVCEDVVTTGGSVREVIDLLKEKGAHIVAVAAVVDRSGATVDFGVPFFAAACLQLANWLPAECPLCAQGQPLVAPGSRHLVS